MNESVLRVFGLAPLQEAILNAARKDPSAHVVQVRATIPSDIDVRELQAAWQHAVREFDVLRTSMHWEAGGRSLQVVHVDAGLSWSVVNLRGLPDDDAARATEDLVARDARAPFDFATAPLCRCTCVVGRDTTVLVVAFHHVAIDGWSMRVVLDFVARTFSALSSGERLPRSTGPAFADCVDVLAARPTEVAEQVIRDMLRGFAPARILRASLGAPLHTGGHAARRARHTLTRDRSATLRATARARRVTLNTLFQAALAVLLARHGDTDRVAFGVTIADRPPAVAGIEAAAGLLMNVLPMVVRVRDHELTSDWLAEVFRVGGALATAAHLPIESAHRCRDDSTREPLYEALLAFENLPELSDAARTTGLWRDVSVSQHSDHAITVYVDPRDRIVVQMIGGADLAGDIDIGVMLERYLVALDGVTHPGHVADIGCIPEQEVARLVEASGTPRAYPRDATLLDLFDASVANRPSALAVVGDGARLTYGELARKSSALAAALGSLGVMPGSTVAHVCLGADAVVAALGIQRAGASVLFIDPADPPARTAVLVDALACRHVLFSGAPPHLESSVALVPLDTTASSAPAPPDAPHPEQAAYTFFTSGSTGTPKPVGSTHRGIVRLLTANDDYALRPDDVMLQCNSLAFDVSAFETWAALVAGATLAVPAAPRPALGAFRGFVRRFGVTSAYFTAGVFHAAIDEAPEVLDGLRVLFVNSDVVSSHHVRRFLERNPGATFVHAYGPTENGIFSTSHALRRPEEVETPLPLGRPTPNTQAFVVDASGRLMPRGAIGELFVTGDGLATGYVRDPEATARKFCELTLGGRRVRGYRTGDRVRLRPDGLLAFHGRADFQIKLRGIRIEPGEIEAHLERHEGVRRAVAVARKDDRGGGQLVAYVVPAHPNFDVESLRTWLAKRLPAALVPDVFVVLDTLPCTPGGKLDRAALPAPPVAVQASAGLRQEGPLEEELAALVASVLHAREVDPTLSFVAAGGSSLSAMALAARIESALGVAVPVQTVLAARDLFELARAVDEETGTGSVKTPLVRAPERHLFPLSLHQEELWSTLERDPVAGRFYHLPVVIRFADAVDAHRLRRAAERVMARQDMLRARFARAAEGVQLAVDAGVPLPWTEVDAGVDGDPDALATALQEAPFDLSRAPLYRMACVRRGEHAIALVFVVHHLVADGWSLGRFLHDLADAYGPGLADRSPEPWQYCDYVAWQRATFEGGVGSLAFWRSHVGDLWREPALTSDASRRTWRCTSQPVELEAETAAVAELAAGLGLTRFPLYLAAFSVALRPLTRRDRFIVATVVSDRNRAEFESVFGYFVSTLPLACDLTGDPTFEELATRNHRAMLAALPHRAFPIELLLRDLARANGGVRPQLLEALFVFFERRDTQLTFDGARAHAYAGATRYVEFPVIGHFEGRSRFVRGGVDLDAGMFPEDEALRFAARFCEALRRGVRDPELPLSELLSHLRGREA